MNSRNWPSSRSSSVSPTHLEAGTVDQALAAVAKHPRGAEWLAAWKEAQDPWFNFTSGNGFYSTDKYWIEHLDIPLGFIRDYIARLAAGETIDRPTEEYRQEARPDHFRICRHAHGATPAPPSRASSGLARTVFPTWRTIISTLSIGR